MKVVIFGCFYLYVYMFIKFDIVGINIYLNRVYF